MNVSEATGLSAESGPGYEGSQDMAGQTNGTAKAIDILEKDVSIIFSLLHEINTKGCPFKSTHDLEDKRMREDLREARDDIKSLKRTLYLAVGAASVINSLVIVLIKAFAS